MEKNKLIYLSESKLPSQSANSIQVMKFCDALSSFFEVSLLGVVGDITNRDLHNYYNVSRFFKTRLFSKFNTVFGLLFLSIQYLVYLLNAKPDIVYSRFLFGAFFSCFKYPTIVEIHSDIWNSRVYFKWALQFVVRSKNCKAIILISNPLKEDFELLFKHNSVHVIPDGANRISLVRNPEMENLYSDKFNVGYIGSLKPGKGLEIIARIALKMINVNFHIVGGDTNELLFWKKSIQSNNVIFHGFKYQDELQSYILKMNVCLLPNQRKILTGKKSDIGKYTSPLKMFEYMSYGKPIIASDLPVLREILTEDCAILVGCDSEEDWINAINLLMNNREMAYRLGNRAREVFELNYTWEIRAKRIYDLIDFKL